jgi:hypothetical protein
VLKNKKKLPRTCSQALTPPLGISLLGFWGTTGAGGSSLEGEDPPFDEEEFFSLPILIFSDGRGVPRVFLQIRSRRLGANFKVNGERS